MEQDIRWQQRFHNYTKVLSRFQEAVDLAKSRELSQLEKQGLIQSFEFTQELSWKVMKDFLSTSFEKGWKQNLGQHGDSENNGIRSHPSPPKNHQFNFCTISPDSSGVGIR